MRNYELHPDGDRLAVLTASEGEAEANRVVLILNFFDELRRVAPVGRR